MKGRLHVHEYWRENSGLDRAAQQESESSPMEMLGQLNWFDVALAITSVGVLFLGFMLGFYRQMALVFGAVLGVFFAGHFTSTVLELEFLRSNGEQLGEGGLRVAVYLTLAAIPVGLALLSFLAFPRAFGKTLRFFDSLFGGALGLTFATILVCCCTLDAVPEKPRWFDGPIQDSYLGSRIARGGDVVARLLPSDLRERVSDGFQRQLDPLREPRG